MNRISKLAVIIGATVVLAACAGTRVATDYDRGARFDTLRSFAWVAPVADDVEDPLLDSELLTRKMRRSVVEELSRRGYEQAPGAADADFLVTYHTASRERLRDRGGFSVGFGFGRYSRFGHQSLFLGDNYFPRIEGYQEGTLIIDVLDARTQELVWRGWMRNVVDERHYTEDAVEQTVRAILAEFPPGRTPA